MKRWVLLALVLVIVAASLFIVHMHLSISPPVVHSHLGRVPDSAFKYHLCTESYAFVMAAPDNPYKTDFTFHDPFRNGNDTIIPRYLGYNQGGKTVSFSVQMIFSQVATYNETISHVSELDGIFIYIPDTQNRLQRSSIPQFIVSYLPTGNGIVAVLDYTCPEQWIWSVMPA